MHINIDLMGDWNKGSLFSFIFLKYSVINRMCFALILVLSVMHVGGNCADLE